MTLENTVKENEQFHFPLYIYLNFYEIKETLKKAEELKLYAAFEEVLVEQYNKAYILAQEAYSISLDYPFKITCLYVMARCSLYQNKYSLFMKNVLQINQLFANEFDHKEEMQTLLIDLETYYKGYDSLLSAKFDNIYEYDHEVFPIVTTLTLYRQILISFKNKQIVDTSIYEMSLKLFEDKGYIFPALLLSSELALLLYNQKQYKHSKELAKRAYELALENNGFFMLTELYYISPKVIDEALEYYGITIDSKLKKMTKELKHSYIGLMFYLKKPKSIFAFTNDDYDYILYAINNYTNKEIAKEKSISENAVYQRYAKLYRSFDVSNKKELVSAFINSLDEF